MGRLPAGKIDPKLLVALAAAIVVVVVVKLSNPYRKYSTQQFWETATVATVADVPDKVLARGNRNGGVLMWAAMGAKDPQILRALVARGANVNERDSFFGGTPMSAAAAKSTHPDAIATLASLGADVNQPVKDGDTPVMIAARNNRTPGIIEALEAAGADLTARNDRGQTAVEIARFFENEIALRALLAHPQASGRDATDTVVEK